MIQIEKIGTQYVKIEKEASNFFDRQFLMDLIENKNGYYLESNSREYDEKETFLV